MFFYQMLLRLVGLPVCNLYQRWSSLAEANQTFIIILIILRVLKCCLAVFKFFVVACTPPIVDRKFNNMIFFTIHFERVHIREFDHVKRVGVFYRLLLRRWWYASLTLDRIVPEGLLLITWDYLNIVRISHFFRL